MPNYQDVAIRITQNMEVFLEGNLVSINMYLLAAGIDGVSMVIEAYRHL